MPHVLVNSKIYKGSEKFFIQYLADELGFPKMSNMAVLEAYLSYLMTSDFRCVFVFTNAEEMPGFSSLLIQNFLKFISMVGILIVISPVCFAEPKEHETSDDKYSPVEFHRGSSFEFSHKL